MNDYLEENYQNQIFQSFAKNINDEPQKVTNSSSKKENIEFTFKKLIFGSNKNKEMEKEFENNIYSKNDKNIKQSGHFFNEIKNESKYKQLLKNDKGKNNLIKPLFKFIEHKKIKLKRLKINKINKKIFIKTLENMQKSRMTTIGTNYLKRDFNFNSKNDKKTQGNNQINSTTYINNTNNISNITNFNNNSKFIINFVTQTPLNTFLEISHDSYFENNENKNENTNSNKENINLNSNKENIKANNIKVNDYEIIFNKNKKIPDKIYNNTIMSKVEEKKNSSNMNLNTIHTNKTRNNPKNKKEKYDKNISFDIVKNEYKELKQKIFENKIKKKAYKLNKGYITKINPEKKMSTNKSSVCNKRMNKFNQTSLSTTTYFKKNIKQKPIKNLKINKISFISSYNSFNNESDLFNTHRRMKSIASNYLSK
jgi:hypothetical protein